MTHKREPMEPAEKPARRRPAGFLGRLRLLPAILVAAAIALGGATGVVGALWVTDDGIPAGGGAVAPAASGQPGSTAGQAPAPAGEEDPGPDLGDITPTGYKAMPLPGEMRAMWFSFLEWRKMDFSGEEAFRAQLAEAFDNCKAMGLNTVMVAARPFGDALYESGLFPWSHVMNGAQGQDPGFDPLAVMVEEGHARSLRVEAWLNPYRVKDNVNGPEALSEDNPALTRPELVRDLGGNLWYDPGLPEVRRLVMEGAVEILLNYEVDGIHFDDYFYPEFSAQQVEEGLDVAFDADTYAAHAQGENLAQWRRENVNTMVRDTYAAVKAANPTASFGISPQGNNDNNYQIQYSDVKYWMENPGYVDYVMPQLYWGFNYLTQSGRNRFAFENIVAEWAFYPRSDAVKLYAGLGAYRLGLKNEDGSRDGFGDGGAGDQTEWESGRNLADMVAHLRGAQGFNGFSLFRYEFLVQPGDDLSAAERDALTAEIRGEATEAA